MKKHKLFYTTITFLVNVLLVYSGNTYAQPSKGPIQISAKTISLDNQSGKIIYEGDVIVTQDDSVLKCDHLLLNKSGKNIQSMVANGNPAKFSRGKESENTYGFGEAEEIVYNVTTAKIDLYRKASLLQNGDKVSGDHLIYNLDTKELLVKSDKPKRANFTFQSKDDKKR